MPEVPFELAPEDQRVVDELVDSGFDPEVIGAMSAEERARAERLMGLMDLLGDYPVEDSDDALVHATMARIDRAEDERAARMAFDLNQAESSGRGAGRRIRLPDFISVAAVILIAAGVLWPTMTRFRQRSVDLQCANQLRQVGYAFSNYRADHDDQMPMATASFGPAWKDVRHVVNLGPLVERGYCDHGHLNCPGVDEHADASYSYQWQLAGSPGRSKVNWASSPRMTLVLGDRNPLIDAYRARRSSEATAASLNHGGRGQNALANDGSTLWLVRPVIGHDDNIWLPAGSAELKEGVVGDEPWDVFLAH
ncbi:MAG: hypothetical protein GY715_19050 [Planctomycetes bacterium]|nr:hypothetical protein [Planctomycetota bacterium]